MTCGLSGSGKSTLARHALSNLSDKLNYLNTVTTRPQRSNEDTLEYTFTSLPEYECRKAQSSLWDESIIYENYYGVDAGYYIDRMDDGQNFIVCSVPSNNVIDEMSAIYSKWRIKTIHIPTFQSAAMERMRQRDTKVDMARVAIDAAITQERFDADYTLSLSGSLEVDKERFLNIVRSIIA
jgi:guanylate kinase